MINRIILFLLLNFSFVGYGQSYLSVFNITHENSSQFFERRSIGSKTNPELEVYENPYEIALSFYPELKDVSIKMGFKSIKTTMAVRPRGTFLFKQKQKREYRLIFNNHNFKNRKVRFEELSLNAQVGIIGHELGHIVDFEKKSKGQILTTGVKYLFKKHKKRLESEIDYIAIEHGLGWQVYDFCDFVINRSECCQEYKEYKRDNYFSPDEILFLIRNLKYFY